MKSSAPNPFIAIVLGILLLPFHLLRAVFSGLASLFGGGGEDAWSVESIECSAGHVREIRSTDRYKCSCGAVFQGMPWSPCPVCGESASVVTCDCGLAIPLPWHQLPGGDDD